MRCFVGCEYAERVRGWLQWWCGARGRCACSECVDGTRGSGIVVAWPLQPSLFANPGCPGPERSILVSSRLACPITSHGTDHWGEPCNQTGEVHPVDPFFSVIRCRLNKRVSSSLMGGDRFLLLCYPSCCLLLYWQINDVWSAWSVYFLLFPISGNTVWLCLVKIFSFISLGGRSILVMWWLTVSVSRHYIYIYIYIAQKEGSSGPRPVASQSHCISGRYLTFSVSLWWSLMLHSERAVSCQCLTR